MRIVHQLATCMDCDWVNSDYLDNTAKKAAKEHHRRTGHCVVGETGIAWRFEKKQKTKRPNQ